MDWTGKCESVRIDYRITSGHWPPSTCHWLVRGRTSITVVRGLLLRVSADIVSNTRPHTHTHTYTHGTAPQSVWDRQTDRRTDASQHCLMPPIGGGTTRPTRNSAIAEGPRDASCRLKSCQLPRNSAETTCTTSPEPSIGCR